MIQLGSQLVNSIHRSSFNSDCTVLYNTYCIDIHSLLCVMISSCSFTARVDELIRVLKDLQVGKYQRTMVSNKPAEGGQGECGQGVLSRK